MTSKKDCMGERLAKLETDITYIKLEQVSNREDNKSEHEELKKMIKEFITSADKKYASKLVETVMWSLIGLIVSSVIIAVLGLVFKVF